MLSDKIFKIEGNPFYITGKFQGKKEGKTETLKETALLLKKKGVDLQLISDVTELPIEEIEAF